VEKIKEPSDSYDGIQPRNNDIQPTLAKIKIKGCWVSEFNGVLQ